MIYADIGYAEDFFATCLWTDDWDAANITDKNKALTMATKIIDQLNFLGDKADPNQENQFPRGTDTEVPNAIKEACVWIAKALIEGVNPEKEFENLFLLMQHFEGARVTFDSKPAPNIVAGVPSSTAWRLLYPFLRDGAVITLRRVD